MARTPAAAPPVSGRRSSRAEVGPVVGPGVGTVAQRAAVVVSAAVAVLALVAASAGLLLDEVYGAPASLAEMLRGYDLVTAAAAVPALVLSLVAARRGSDRGRLVAAGVLAYLAYSYAFYVFGTTFNDLFLLHIALFGGSVVALGLTVSTLDVARIARRLGRRTPRRLVASALGLLAAALGGLWVYSSLRSAATGAVPEGSALVEPESVVHLGIALDLALLVPAYAVASVLLWRGAAWGFVLAALVPVSGTLHQVGYLVALPFQVAAGVPGAVGFDPGEPVIALLFVSGTALLLRGASGQESGPEDGARQP